MTDFRHWLRDLNGRRVTADDIAHKLGVSRTTVTRRLVNDELTADELITLANAYDVNPLQALVDLGRITDQQVWAYLESGGQLVETAEDAALALELARRLNPATVAPEIDMLAARRTEKSNGQVPPTKTPSPPPEHDGTVRDFDWEPGTYAADNSTNEGKAREERGEDPID
ncbi:winged helix-turn-helix domain-containing protein [Acidipropionibacterium jensenii]|uniref:winged helix-turn-helix domain-containing protein n=1 Tax=Acidipropionibacterium jensenii TaxID=1749 RepID=UPI0026479D0D|nr:helix-turn-helix transcriptional regulator [Acidipropionibacterium jensenii]MDN6428045.1 helix-turn-helix domain-containing protein [Acidipropionibacterium jensenii]